jgi:hypothetical protein
MRCRGRLRLVGAQTPQVFHHEAHEAHEGHTAFGGVAVPLRRLDEAAQGFLLRSD